MPYPWGFVPPSPDLFDDEYFGTNDMVLINTGTTHVPLRYQTFFTTFPRLAGFRHSVSLPTFANKLGHGLRTRQVNRRFALETLELLFESLSLSENSHASFTATIVGRLEEAMQTDFYNMQSRSNNGFHDCRRYFVTLASFAKMTASARLASALTEFFLCNALPYGQICITSYERSKFLMHWGLAIMDLRRYITAADFKNCLEMLALRFDDLVRLYQLRDYRDRRAGELIALLQSAAVTDESNDFEFRKRPRRNMIFHQPPPRQLLAPPPAEFLVPAVRMPQVEFTAPHFETPVEAALQNLNDRLQDVEDVVQPAVPLIAY